MQRLELELFLDDYLKVADYKDYAPNGLQVEGRSEINTIVTGVTASQALIDKAVELNADAILVHHGYFWKSEPQQIVGFKQKRIKTLLKHDINLFGYHLPLDGHDEVGNNVLLGKLWGLKESQAPVGLVRIGELTTPLSIDEFKSKVDKSLNRESLHLTGGPDKIKTVAWCSGGAQGYIDQAVSLGADVYISGEVSEQTTHLAQECGIHYLAAGHHATERLGIKALGEYLADKFGLNCHFVDIPNPV
jgi:dinuclear metal center YbgI/SA1388 family protein